MAAVLDLTAPTQSMLLDRGVDYDITVGWTDDSTPPQAIPLTGYTARMEFRVKVGVGESLLTLTTENEGITLDGPAGTLTLHIPNETATLIPGNVKSTQSDIEVVSPAGKITKLYKVQVEWAKEATTL